MPLPTCGRCGHQYEITEYQFSFPEYLVDSNQALSPAEQELAAEFLKSGVPKLEQDIQQLEALIKALSQKRDRMHKYLQRSKCLLPPIRQVPREIIGEIIVTAILDTEFYQVGIPPVTLNTRTDLWRFSHVCRLWREEVLSRRLLWSYIDINPERERRPNVGLLPWRKRCHVILDTILSRSGDLSLKLRAVLTDGAVEFILFLALIDQSHRWRDVVLELSTDFLPHLQELEGRLPKLEALDLQTYNGAPEHLAGVLSTAPALRRVRLGGFGAIEKIDLPWSQLTHLIGAGGVVFQYRLPNLQILHISDFKSNAPVLRHDCITSIVAYRSNLAFLDYLVLPSLSELRLGGDSIVDPTATQAILSLINRSQCHIHTLFLDPRDVGHLVLQSPLIYELSSLSSITKLALPLYLGGEFSSALAKRSIFPNVNVVQLGYSFLADTSYFDVDNFIRRLNSWGKTGQLREIRFMVTGSPPSRVHIDTARENLRKYKHLEEVGIQLGFVGYTSRFVDYGVYG